MPCGLEGGKVLGLSPPSAGAAPFPSAFVIVMVCVNTSSLLEKHQNMFGRHQETAPSSGTAFTSATSLQNPEGG